MLSYNTWYKIIYTVWSCLSLTTISNAFLCVITYFSLLFLSLLLYQKALSPELSIWWSWNFEKSVETILFFRVSMLQNLLQFFVFTIHQKISSEKLLLLVLLIINVKHQYLELQRCQIVITTRVLKSQTFCIWEQLIQIKLYPRQTLLVLGCNSQNFFPLSLNVITSILIKYEEKNYRRMFNLMETY